MKSSGDPLRFGDYTLDPENRVLLRDGTPIELGSRYLDALLLLARDAGRLVTKERLHDEVWRGVPVTDEALTQCIRALRRALGDDAANPRFIETVPKHGYRFVASIGAAQQTTAATRGAAPPTFHWPMLTAGGGIGGAVAGIVIGLAYGLSLARGEQASGAGLSLVAVVACCGALAGLFSGLAIAGGIAAAERFQRLSTVRSMIGGAAGGLIAGTVFNMLGRDAIGLLFGRRVIDLASGLEGVVLGAVIGAGLWWLRHPNRNGYGAVLPVAAAGAVAGFVLTLIGGTLFGGSLAALAEAVPGSLFTLPTLFGLPEPLGEAFNSALEGALFAAGVVLGSAWAETASPGVT